MLKQLQGKRFAILAADGFEKIELALPLRALKLEGAQVDIVSLHKGKIRGMNLHRPANTYFVDRTIQDASAADYDGLFIPGGFINPDLLRQSQAARNFVKAFSEANKPIASLCHGPWVLASADLLRGRRLTSWPGIRDDMVNSGAIWLNHKVVRDRNLVTARGPQDLVAFIPAMIELFDKGFVREEGTLLETSDAQEIEAPRLVQQTISWVSGFPYKWAAGAALVGLGTYGVVTGKGGTFRNFFQENRT